MLAATVVVKNSVVVVELESKGFEEESKESGFVGGGDEVSRIKTLAIEAVGLNSSVVEFGSLKGKKNKFCCC